MSSAMMSPDEFSKMLHRHIEDRTREIIAEETSKISEIVARRMEAEADKIALSIMKTYEMSRDGDTVLIRVIKT